MRVGTSAWMAFHVLWKLEGVGDVTYHTSRMAEHHVTTVDFRTDACSSHVTCLKEAPTLDSISCMANAVHLHLMHG